MTLDELKTSLWGAAVLLRGKINATGYKEYIFPLVFFKRISDVHAEEFGMRSAEGGVEYAECCDYTFNIPKGCMWNDIREVTENVGQALVTAWTRIEQANPDRVVGDRVVEGLGGIFGKRDHWTNKNILTDETLSELIEHFSKFDLSIASCPADEMGQAYEYLVGKFADDAGNTAQEFYTNRTVVELMAEILEPKAGESIYDPTCGTGGMLISCIAHCKGKCGAMGNECGVRSDECGAMGNECGVRSDECGAPSALDTPPSALRTPNWKEIKAYGQEQNALTSSVARMNLFLHGVEEFRIINDDTLLRPGFLDAGNLKTFDVVLANPPYSIKKWNRELFSNDPYGRNFLGTPPQGRADYAFIQHILKSMNPKTGRCAILLPHGVLFREEEKSIRKALIEADILEAVIGLAPNLFYNSPMEACIMVCRANKPSAAKGRILFINAVNEVTRKNAESRLEMQHIEKILKAYGDRLSDKVFSYDATTDEVAANDWSLAISLYAHAREVRSAECEVRSLEDALIHQMLSADEAENQLAQLGSAIIRGVLYERCIDPLIPEVNIPHKGEVVKVKLGDVAEEVRGNWIGDTKDVPIVGLEHLEPDEIWLRKWQVNPSENTFTKAFRKGQLLFGRRRAYQKKLSLAPCDGICSGDITVIAAKSDKVLPELLPFILRTDSFFDFAIQGSAGSLSPRVKWAHLADYEFELPDLTRQKELADLLWAANDLKEAYKKAISATDEMLKAKFREMFGECGVQSAECGVRVDKCGVRSAECGGGGMNQGEFTQIGKISKFFSLKAGKNIKAEDINNVSGGSKTLPCYGGNGIRGYVDEYSHDGCYCIIGRQGEYSGNVQIASGKFFATEHAVVVTPLIDIEPIWLCVKLRQMNLLQYSRGVAQPGLAVANLKDIEIEIPPLSLQREFVAIAEKADEAKASLSRSIAALDQVMKGLING